MKSWKIKALFFTLSLILSVITAEIFLRFMVAKTNLPRVYHDVSEYNLSTTEEAGKSEYVRDRSMEIYSGSEGVEILCVGDSFTNGGNTFWDNSYPYKLYQKLDKKITVRNLGVCASTTGQIADRIKNFYTSDQYSPKKKYILVIMGGSADVFAGNQLIQKIPELNISDKQHWKVMSANSESPLHSFYFYKVVVMLAREMKNNFLDLKYRVPDQIKYSSDLLSDCHKNSSSEKRVACYLNSLNSDKYSKLDKNSREYQVIRALLENKTFKSSEVTETLQDFMGLIEVMPQFLERDYLVMNLLGLVHLQDIVSYKELESSIVRNSERINPKSKETNLELISNVSFWYGNIDKLNQERSVYWDRILKLAGEHNSKVVLMNYPLAYKSTNDYLEKLQKVHGLDFINVEAEFADQKNAGKVLLDDWEHCSPEGYDLIADLIHTKIKAEIK